MKRLPVQDSRVANIHRAVTDVNVVDSSTWLKVDGKWKCAAHTETRATGR